MTGFTQQVFDYVQTIPRGEVRTYGEVARAIGRPGSARAVGNVLNTNHDAAIPCHRVIKSDGTPGGFNRGTAAKIKKLKNEGYDFTHR